MFDLEGKVENELGSRKCLNAGIGIQRILKNSLSLTVLPRNSMWCRQMFPYLPRVACEESLTMLWKVLWSKWCLSYFICKCKSERGP